MAIEEGRAEGPGGLGMTGRADFLAWMEGEVLEAKAQVGQAKKLLEALQDQLWQTGQRLQEVAERQEALAGRVANVLRLENEISRLPARLEHLEWEEPRLQERLAEQVNQRRADMDLLLQEGKRTSDSLEEIGQRAAGWEERLVLLEGGLNRHREGQEVLSSEVADLTEEVRDLKGHIPQHGERFRQIDDRIAQIEDTTEGFRHQLQALAEQIHLQAGQSRRLEDGLAELAQEQARLPDLAEKQEILRLQGERRDERLDEMEQQREMHQERLTEMERAMNALEGRANGLSQLLALLQEEMKENVKQVWKQLSHLEQWQDRQQRRHMEALEQSLRELKSYGPKPPQD